MTRLFGILLAWTALLWACAAAAGQEQADGADARAYAEATAADGGRYFVPGFVFEFETPNPDHPTAEELLRATMRLDVAEDGYLPADDETAPMARVSLAEVEAAGGAHFYASALPEISRAVVRRLQALGLIGVYVEPDRAQLRVEGGRVVDLRASDEEPLRLVVTTAKVEEVRTLGLGERLESVPEDERQLVNNPVHRRIIERSPLQPYEPGDEERSDLLLRPKADDYVYRLNRHPGRRVDLALSAGDEPGSVILDYMVTENRPWLLFAQLSNTGTSDTDELRERFGFIHNQLTNNDDILIVDYLTANFDEVHAVLTSYEAPVFDSERLRWRVYGSWFEYTASEVGQLDNDFDGEGWGVGGEFIWNFYQNRDWFMDLVAGARWAHDEVDNELAGTEGNEDFFLPYVGWRLERNAIASSTNASLTVEWNLADVAGTSESGVDELGRALADDEWTVLFGDVSHTFYLEPLFAERRDGEFVDPEELSLAHELAFSLRGQYAFDNRLVPNAQQILGGLYSVRGYPQAVVAGDSVLVGTAEYRWHIPRGLAPTAQAGDFFGSPFRWRPQYPAGPVDWDLIFKVFVDAGRVWNSDPQAFETDNTLVGAGIGLELSLTRRFNARVDWGFALEDVEDGNGQEIVEAGDDEIYFVITAIF